MGGDNGSCPQQRQELTGEAIDPSCLLYLRPPFISSLARAQQYLMCDFVDGGAVGCLLSARTSFSSLSLDSSADEPVYFLPFP